MSCKAGDCSRRSRDSDLGGAFRNEEEGACGRVVTVRGLQGKRCLRGRARLWLEQGDKRTIWRSHMWGFADE